MTTLTKPITLWAKGIIFDFDFTLGDSSDAVIECVNHALAEVGSASAPDALIKQQIGLPLNLIFGNLGAADVERARDLFIERADKIMVDMTTLYPGVVTTLKEAASKYGFKYGLVSTKNHHRLVSILKKFGIRDLFESIVGADDVSRPKPAPEATLRALRELKLSNHETIFLGDSLADAGSAKAAGVPFVGVETGTTSGTKLIEAGAAASYASVTRALSDLCFKDTRQVAARHYVFQSAEAVEAEVEITTFKSSGPGGQKKNKTESSVRIKHLPTGIMAVGTESRSQHTNREIAMEGLIKKLQALNPPPMKPRKKLPVPPQVKKARLADKNLNSKKKKLRRKPGLDD